MTREEQIEQKAKELGQKYFPNKYNIWARPNHEAQCVEFACKEMVKWVDEHPNAIDMSYLQNWYQDSIDETKEPIWTDQHLEELFNDFYLIPKSK